MESGGWNGGFGHGIRPMAERTVERAEEEEEARGRSLGGRQVGEPDWRGTQNAAPQWKLKTMTAREHKNTPEVSKDSLIGLPLPVPGGVPGSVH